MSVDGKTIGDLPSAAVNGEQTLGTDGTSGSSPAAQQSDTRSAGDTSQPPIDYTDARDQKTSAYTPGTGGNLEGGFELSPNPFGATEPSTLVCYAEGECDHVTLAGPRSTIGEQYMMQTMTFTDTTGEFGPKGADVTLNDVPARVEDLCPACAIDNHFDVALVDGRNNPAAYGMQDAYGYRNVQALPVTQIPSSLGAEDVYSSVPPPTRSPFADIPAAATYNSSDGSAFLNPAANESQVPSVFDWHPSLTTLSAPQSFFVLNPSNMGSVISK